MRENHKSTNVAHSVFVNESCPNLDYKYGLYNSVEEAYEVLGESGDDVIALGLTVGIKTENGVVEYWFKNGTTLADLVPKNTDAGLEEKIVENEKVAAAAFNELKKANIALKQENAELRKVVVENEKVTAAALNELQDKSNHIEVMFPSDDADGNGIPDGIDKLNKLEQESQSMTESEVSDVWNEVFGS